MGLALYVYKLAVYKSLWYTTKRFLTGNLSWRSNCGNCSDDLLTLTRLLLVTISQFRWGKTSNICLFTFSWLALFLMPLQGLQQPLPPKADFKHAQRIWAQLRVFSFIEERQWCFQSFAKTLSSRVSAHAMHFHGLRVPVSYQIWYEIGTRSAIIDLIDLVSKSSVMTI
jgi:hypothetical protein